MAKYIPAFIFPWGGEDASVAPGGGKTWLFNLRPFPEELESRLLPPISFSIRKTDDPPFVDPSTFFVSVGYSKLYSTGAKEFDQDLPRTSRLGFTDILTNNEPSILVIPGGPPSSAVRIRKRIDGAERSIYFTKVNVDDPHAFRNVLLSALIQPITVSLDDGSRNPQGPLIGLELGPRNKAVYVFFKNYGGTKKILVTGAYGTGSINAPARVITYDWSVNKRYSLLWNESRDLVQLFANNDTLIVSIPIEDFPEFGQLSPKHGSKDDYVAVYGVEGKVNEEAEISNIAILDDVGYPLVGTTRPNSYTTFLRTADVIRTRQGVDPRTDPVSPWFTDNGALFPMPDPQGDMRLVPDAFRLSKVSTDQPYGVVLFREECGFYISDTQGLVVDLTFTITSTLLQGDTTGVGFAIHDGQTAFRVNFLKNKGKFYVGLLKFNGDETSLDDHFAVEYDWSSLGSIRLVADKIQNVIRFFSHEDLNVPLFEMVFDRSLLPTPGDYGWLSFNGFFAIGHVGNTTTAGAIYIHELSYTHVYHSWAAHDGVMPEASLPSWTAAATGSPVLSLTSDRLQIACDDTQTKTYHRAENFDVSRGAMVEARVAIPSSKPNQRTGECIILDDGLRSFILTFTETNEGKFACLAISDGAGSFKEVAGRDGPGESLSFRIDWTQPHTYRMERRPFDGVYIFVDDDPKPALFFPESRLIELPATIYSTGSGVVAFGHFRLLSASTAQWSFVHTWAGTGFEVSFKKNEADKAIKTDLFASQAVVLVESGPLPPPPPPCGDFVFGVNRSNAFRFLPDMIGPHDFYPAAAYTSEGSKLLIMGGTDDDGVTFNNRVDVLDIATETWSVGPTLVAAGMFPAAVTAPDCTVYLLSQTPGTATSVNPGNLMKRDPHTGVWTALATIPDYHPSTSPFFFQQPGKLFMSSDKTKIITFSTRRSGRQIFPWTYTISTDTWVEGLQVPINMDTTSCDQMPDGRIILIGGEDLDLGPTAHAVIYDPATDLWAVQPDLPFRLDAACVVALRGPGTGKVVVMGGRPYDSGVGSYQSLLYDTVTHIWSAPSGNVTNHVLGGMTGFSLENGNAWFGCGTMQITDQAATFYSHFYDYNTNSIIPGPFTHSGRERAIAVLLPDSGDGLERVLIAGGKARVIAAPDVYLDVFGYKKTEVTHIRAFYVTNVEFVPAQTTPDIPEPYPYQSHYNNGLRPTFRITFNQAVDMATVAGRVLVLKADTGQVLGAPYTISNPSPNVIEVQLGDNLFSGSLSYHELIVEDGIASLPASDPCPPVAWTFKLEYIAPVPPCLSPVMAGSLPTAWSDAPSLPSPLRWTSMGVTQVGGDFRIVLVAAEQTSSVPAIMMLDLSSGSVVSVPGIPGLPGGHGILTSGMVTLSDCRIFLAVDTAGGGGGS